MDNSPPQDHTGQQRAKTTSHLLTTNSCCTEPQYSDVHERQGQTMSLLTSNPPISYHIKKKEQNSKSFPWSTTIHVETCPGHQPPPPPLPTPPPCQLHFSPSASLLFLEQRSTPCLSWGPTSWICLLEHPPLGFHVAFKYSCLGF